MHILETLVVAAIVAILLAVLVPMLWGVLQDTRAYISLLQVNHAARTLQFTDLAPSELAMIRKELGMNEPVFPGRNEN